MSITTLTGPELADRVLRRVGNEDMIAGARLLGRFRDGFWLRKFLAPDESDRRLGLDSVVTPEHADGHGGSIDWARVHELLERGLPQSSGEIAVLEIAASLADNKHAVNLYRALRPLGHEDVDLVLAAIRETAEPSGSSATPVS